ncbi:AraC family ligand binding domain-containing protein [Streptomyces sp. NPDC057445]|uniref:AraC family transcriptional regulator n=1 Tax=Streptomyces sp. NPDC057445 TaxID=3346136 RepID=UPI0036D183A3
MHAHFHRHVYARHSHDAYSFGFTEAGAQRFSCRGGAHTSAAGLLMAFNPDDPHDGRAAADLGYRYRMVHIGPELVRDVLADATAGHGTLPLFTAPVLHDPVLRGSLMRLHTALAGGADPLVRDERLAAAVTAMVRRGASGAVRVTDVAGGARSRAARRARELLRERYEEQVPAQWLADAAGLSRFALYRAFRAEYGMTPSDYQRLLRLRRGRELLAGGATAAQAAVESGFADQPHFHRWFMRYYGVTPGAYRRAASRA